MQTTFRTIQSPGFAEFKDKGSRFLAYVYPVLSVDEINRHWNVLKKEHFKAVHHCLAYRLGTSGNMFRAYDDGEPSGSAGAPMLGQIDSFALTDTAVIVVRYFGGTLLGVPGLIRAYKTVTRDALSAVEIIEKPLLIERHIVCDYALLGEVLRASKHCSADVVSQDLQVQCTLLVRVPMANIAAFDAALEKHHTIIFN